jgi:hypothetical protein
MQHKPDCPALFKGIPSNCTCSPTRAPQWNVQAVATLVRVNLPSLGPVKLEDLSSESLREIRAYIDGIMAGRGTPFPTPTKEL